MVIGGTPAGISAAISAARAGKKVVIVEQAPVLGGMLSSGVSRADDAVVEANSGIFEEFRQRVARYHLTDLAADPVVRDHLARNPVRHNVARGQAWEAKTAARIYAEMVKEAGSIRTVFQQVPVSAVVEGDRLKAVITRDKQGKDHRYDGKVFATPRTKAMPPLSPGFLSAWAGKPGLRKNRMRATFTPTHSARSRKRCLARFFPAARAWPMKGSRRSTTGSWSRTTGGPTTPTG